MKREEIISKVQVEEAWDVIIIGGGASGLGAAIESATRGYKTILLADLRSPQNHWNKRLLLMI